MPENKRLQREKKTVKTMIEIFCRGNHRSEELCSSCQALLDYAFKRVNACKFGVGKPTCANCPIHCYKPDMREQIRAVMRYSGPRMLYKHPGLAIRHMLDNHKKPKAART